MTEPKNYTREIHSNLTDNTPNQANKWFMDPPNPAKPDEYCQRPGNDITLLNCGEEYLPALREAIKNAQHTIYIVIWGMDDMLKLDLDQKNSKIPPIFELLIGKAKEGVKVKIIVWLGTLLVTSFRSLLQSRWWIDAFDGKFDNLQLIPCDLDGSIEKGIRKLIFSLPFGLVGIIIAVTEHILENSDLQEFIEKGIIAGLFPTHHQKVILIDHSFPTIANGFVQGFNLTPDSFDLASHPWISVDNTSSEKTNQQDVGLHLKGPCLKDLFLNFKERWNYEIKFKKLSAKNATPITEAAPQILAFKEKDSEESKYYCAQILRTWPIKGEQQIYKFIKNAIPQINSFIYIEDQYFRMPEFAKLLVKRADTINKKSPDKKLYVFVVTRPDSIEVANRLEMCNILENNVVDQNGFKLESSDDEYIQKLAKDSKSKQAQLNDIIANKHTEPGYNPDSKTLIINSIKGEIDDINKQIESIRKNRQAKLDKIDRNLELKKTKNQLEKKNIKVHICQLIASKTVKYGKHEITHYRNIRVHSKISFYDNAYTLLGSANWHKRGMTQDSELDILVENHNDLAQRFRENLWKHHLNEQWQAMNPNYKNFPVSDEYRYYKCEDWFDKWTDLLSINWTKFKKGEPLKMNLFPFYDDFSRFKPFRRLS